MLWIKERLRELLPLHIAELLEKENIASAEEIRLRIGKRPSFVIDDKEKVFDENEVTRADIAHVVDRASRSSFHAV
ncbi:MAG: hypothetical protein IKV79_07835, partial [Oscillospiraceae bacterium]|nr:hypothetical protein [Oscillospiraceae bacterium]